MNVVALLIDELWIALDAADVEEVLGERTWTPVRGRHPALVGAMAWRGGAIAVVDLMLLLVRPAGLSGDPDGPRAPASARRRCPVLRCSDATWALPVDHVREVVEVDESSVFPSLAMVSDRPDRSPGSRWSPSLSTGAYRLSPAASALVRAEVEAFGQRMPLLDARAIVSALLEAGCAAA